jgi:deoxyribodipyrimidine photo-lyase
MRPLVWFRHDLRVDDNPALFHACQAADEGVVAVFTICPRQWRDEHDWADIKVAWLLSTLRDLKDRLFTLNIPLKIITTPNFDGVPDALATLADEAKCDRLYLNREYAWNEARRDEAVERAMDRVGRTVHPYHGTVLHPPGSIRTKSEGTYYTVYSPFKKACYALDEQGDTPEVLPAPRKQREIDVSSDDIPDTVEGFDPNPTGLDLWAHGEQAAQRQLTAFVSQRIAAYKDERDFPAVDATSVLSHHLHLGSISPAQCVAAAREANAHRIDKGGKGPVHWVSEVLWREFYRHVMHGFPRVCKGRAFRPEFQNVPWRDDPEALAAWKEGRTGYPIVDAAMRSLTQTGWMHNRLRMVVAMFLTKHLLIDWRLGEQHFMRHLVDGDLASNNGGWQWSASTGTDAQPYFRIFNPTSQSRKFDPDGEFIRRWVPELEPLDGDIIHEPHTSGLAMANIDYPPPIVDQKAGRERALEVFEAVRKGT